MDMDEKDTVLGNETKVKIPPTANPANLLDSDAGFGYNHLVKVTRNYKDRVFTDLFGNPADKEAALSLYNALNGTNYQNADDLEFVTLNDVIFAGMKNDVAFIFANYLNMYEQQSTVNPNMPQRSLLYFAAESERLYWRNNPAIYGKSLMKISSPKCVVLYNGTQEQPACSELKLSDAFNVPSPGYEWTVFCYNINKGYNSDILDRCEKLSGYSTLVEMIRENRKENLSVEESVAKAVDDCIHQGILEDYLVKNRKRAISSLLTEYDEEATRAYLQEEAHAEGHAEGFEEALVGLVNDGLLSVDVAAAKLNMPPGEFEALRQSWPDREQN